MYKAGKSGELELGPDMKELAGMRVPKGGSSCKTCKFLGKDELTCDNKYFVKWNHGSKTLPAPYDEYCSIWYEPAKGTLKT